MATFLKAEALKKIRQELSQPLLQRPGLFMDQPSQESAIQVQPEQPLADPEAQVISDEQKKKRTF